MQMKNNTTPGANANQTVSERRKERYLWKKKICKKQSEISSITVNKQKCWQKSLEMKSEVNV